MLCSFFPAVFFVFCERTANPSSGLNKWARVANVIPKPRGDFYIFEDASWNYETHAIQSSAANAIRYFISVGL